MNEKTDKKKIDDNIIYIGRKPFSKYAFSLFTQISKKEQKELKIIARGAFISRAIDLLELAKRKFSEGENKIKEVIIKTGSESFKKKGENGKERDIMVSVIEIRIIKE